jgi:opacity protein-like surface antigen
MSPSSMSKAGLLFALLAPVAGSAQSTSNPSPEPQSPHSNRPTAVVFANGGGNSLLTDLNDVGTASLNTGWTAGVGVGVQVNRFVAVRGTFDFARNESEGSSIGELNGRDLNRYFYGGDVQLRYPTRSGFAPYLLLGAGAVTIDASEEAGLENFTKFAGKGGAGVEYNLGNNVGLFVQGATYVYDYDRNGFDKTQWDLLWTAGLSYRLPR